MTDKITGERLSDIELQDLIALATVGRQRSILLAALELQSLRSAQAGEVEVVAEIEGLIDAYWGLAFTEGREGRDTDTPDDAAQKIRWGISSRIQSVIAAKDAEIAELRRENREVLVDYRKHYKRADAAEARANAAVELRHAFRNADKTDWAHLFAYLPDTHRGRFWKAVMTEALSSLNGAKP